jgi:hypothetical protein
MKNHLLLCFSSFVIPRDPLGSRMEEYAICYEQLKRIIPKNVSLIFLDNTITSINDIINQRLIGAIEESSCLFYNDNIGLINKGMGELDMLVRAEKKLDFRAYDRIIYLTGRRFITCPYVFDRNEKCKEEILVGNQPIINPFLGKEFPSGVDIFGDMFFSMSSSKMIEYCRYSENLLKKQANGLLPVEVGSEQVLYSFIKSNSYPYEEIKHLGFIRNDWEMTNRHTYSREISNFQVI